MTHETKSYATTAKQFTQAVRKHLVVRYDCYDFETFFDHMIATAVWSTTFDADDDQHYDSDAPASSDDFNPDTYRKLRSEAWQFYKDNVDLIQRDGSPMARDLPDGAVDSERKAAMAGHDFWLTRCGHVGAGFWDGDWPQDVSDRLTEASEKFGDVDLYVGDDGMIYGYV